MHDRVQKARIPELGGLLERHLHEFQDTQAERVPCITTRKEAQAFIPEAALAFKRLSGGLPKFTFLFA